MAFSLKQIKAILSSHNMPVEDLDKAAEEIAGRHTADLESIKEERDNLKKDAETLASVQKELEELKEANGKDPFKVKYEALKEEFDDYKSKAAAAEEKTKKEEAFKALLKEVGVSEKRIASVVRVTNLDEQKLDKDGKFENADDLKKSVKEDWADFITVTNPKGADPATPPKNNGGTGTMTKADILKIKDGVERRKAIAENPELFGLAANND